MQDVHFSALLWLFGLVQFAGWSCGFAARLSVRWRCPTLCHAAFAFTLVIVGISTALALALGTKCWLLSATTLAGMILLAIWDFDHSRRPATI
ncbi:MAG TPA: hypothetical protein VFE46_18175 [Pirellulales bacterium]|jgi:hypothetical protein|nr:hypothetical protein [Pirellulales bacterium]